MLEIILVFGLCKHLGGQVRAKGRRAWPYQIMLVVFWLGAEVMTGIAAGIVYAIQYGAVPEQLSLWVYAIALAGAGLGAGLAYLIVALLPPIEDALNTPEQTVSAAGAFGPPPIDSDNPYASPRNR